MRKRVVLWVLAATCVAALPVHASREVMVGGELMFPAKDIVDNHKDAAARGAVLLLNRRLVAGKAAGDTTDYDNAFLLLAA